MTKGKDPQSENEIVGLLRTAVVRSKVSSLKSRQRQYIIDIKIETSEPTNATFMLSSLLDKVVSVKIDKKQLQFGDIKSI